MSLLSSSPAAAAAAAAASSTTASIVIVITGASRGFGRALAITAAASSTTTGVVMKLMLVARSEAGLDETAKLIREQQQQRQCEPQQQDEPPNNNKDLLIRNKLEVTCHPMDLGDLETLDEHLDSLIQEMEEKESTTTTKVIFIQNAGTIGHLGPCRESPSLKDMQANVNLNITSCLWTSARLTKYYHDKQKKKITPPCCSSLTIVNISSLVAIADFPTMGIYSSGKAARDKYHTLIAKEENGEASSSLATTTLPRIRTLNYAPVRKKASVVIKYYTAPFLVLTINRVSLPVLFLNIYEL